ncbi:MAG: hypothetical protein ACTSYD_06015 [Candidatus Heimdallarchaeaceae archaeon]
MLNNKMKKVFYSSIKLLVLAIALIGFSQSSFAAITVFDETFVSDPSYDKIFISYEIIVWSTGHVEVYATYCYFDDNPSKCSFYYLNLQTSILDTIDYGWDTDLPEHAPNVYKEAYAENTNPNVDYWRYDGCQMNIGIQMKFMSYDYAAQYATFQLVMFYHPYSAIGLASSEYIIISQRPIMPDPPLS